MKTRKKYYVAEFVTDFYFYETEQEIYYAESKEAVRQELEKHLGVHLLSCEIRKATWRERRYYKKYDVFTTTI